MLAGEVVEAGIRPNACCSTSGPGNSETSLESHFQQNIEAFGGLKLVFHPGRHSNTTLAFSIGLVHTVYCGVYGVV